MEVPLLLLFVVGGQVHGSLIQDSIDRELQDPWNIRVLGEEYIHLAMIISGNNREDIEHFTSKADRMLQTLCSLSRGRPVHLIFITEQESIAVIARHVESAIAKSLLERILLNSEGWKMAAGRPYRIPKVRTEFVSLSSIVAKHKPTIDHLKTHFNNYDDWYTMKGDPKYAFKPTAKYNHDLFYLGPFFHLVFPLETLIVTDTDIEFKYSVESLHDQFSSFSPSHLYSLAPDLTPFYVDRLHDFRLANPGTQIGEPGPMQGVNTGVVLLHLGRMRESKEFNQFLQPDGIDKLCEKFSFKGFIGDQDWWNLVVWSSPHLLHPLSCSYNYQTTTQLNSGPWKEQFSSYHSCPGEIRVLHGHSIDGNKATG